MSDNKPAASATRRFARAGLVLTWIAEKVSVILLAIMFLAFIVQILFRYLLNLPIGWLSEVIVVTWLWLVLWGAAFVVREPDEIRFDVVYGSAGAPARRIMAVFTAFAIIAIYGWSFPAVWDYVTFMKVQKTAYLGIRYDYLYSIYIVFVLAVLVRYVWILWTSLRGGDAGPDPMMEEETP